MSAGGYERVAVEQVDVSTYTVPTEGPEQDGTLDWAATTLVLVEARAADTVGVGYTYADRATAAFIHEHLAELVRQQDAMAVSANWWRMLRAVRNLGRAGLASMAISAVDAALWDLKARLLRLPLVTLLGQIHSRLPVYGSGGFTNYTDEDMREEILHWRERGISRVKIKVGADPLHDIDRVAWARELLGNEPDLYVDANGAYDRKEALTFAASFADLGVTWFEEPVSSDDLAGLALLRERSPAGMDITAGEYAYDLFTFRRMLEAQAVDVLQADASRCGGITGFLEAATLSRAYNLPLSTHTAPALHLHAACAVENLKHVEHFVDHVRIEERFFDGMAGVSDGFLRPDLSRPGNGLVFKKQDAQRFAA